MAKTADRRVLGTINDLAFTLEHAIAAAGGLARCDIDVLHHGLPHCEVPRATLADRRQPGQ